MKKSIAAMILAILAVSATALGDGKEDSVRTTLPWRPFDAGFAEARSSGKKIMLDVYTDWCVWCKRLDKNVYENPAVAAYLKKHYVLIKLNAESEAKVRYKDTIYTSANFAMGLGVTGYPSIFFFEPSGEPIDKLGGYVDADHFLPIIRYFGEDYFKKMSWPDFQKLPLAPPDKQVK